MPRLLPLLAVLVCTSAAPAADELFEKRVRPLLVEKCQSCHGAKAKGGLRLLDRAGLLDGGDGGPVVVPGDPAASAIVRVLRYDGDVKMPPDGKLSAGEIGAVEEWVKRGAPWPGMTPVAKPADPIAGRDWWAFRPVKDPPAPAVKNTTWPRSDLDRFVLAGLEAKGLTPAAAADPRTLIRRVTFDLTGLPPTPDEVDAFCQSALRDPQSALESLVDCLLNSSAYGERWGRHWLDLARYADSADARGIGGETDIAEAWRYRDWVVRAMNRDLPYDQFLRHQFAGDILSDRDGFDRDKVVATGLLAIGNWGGGDADKEKLLTDIADDQIDVLGRTALGLTLACARCHDHKFDPITTADYYALAGIFTSSHILPDVGPKTNGPPMMRIPLLSPAEMAARAGAKAKLAAAQERRKSVAAGVAVAFARAEGTRTADYLLAAHDAGRGPVAEVARARGLVPFALAAWAELLDRSEPDGVPLGRPVRDLFGKPGVHAVRGSTDPPSAVVNTTAEAVAVSTFRLPPRSVSVHPGPRSGVAVSWRSPVKGAVSVAGWLADGDGTCGDGAAWALDVRRAAGRSGLAAGAFGNGGTARFGSADTALGAVEVAAGDRVVLTVLPKGDYTCDTTSVTLTIRTADGSRAWDLAKDVARDPFPDPGSAWEFLDAGPPRPARPAAVAAALAPWDEAVAAKAGRAGLGVAAKRVVLHADADGNPFRPRTPADEEQLPAAVRAPLAALDAEIRALKAVADAPVDSCHGAQEGGVPGSPHAGVHDVRVHVRGRYDRLGPVVPRRFPAVLAGESQPPITRGSGRLELADWLARPDNPLTARVMANRVWQFHLGEGLVRTPSNFGKLGEKPTHPELLDWLAVRFVADGWSLKKLHRRIVLSATYQQSATNPAAVAADPDNRLWGRANRRRLEAEPLRDALLSVSGGLDRKPGGPADRAPDSPRRAVYLLTVRSDRSGFAPLFDAADSTAPVDKRAVSTVAPQALYLLNHPFVAARAKALAARVSGAAPDDEGRLRFAYALLYARPPTAAEARVGRDFLAAAGLGGWEELAHVLLCANEFAYVD